MPVFGHIVWEAAMMRHVYAAVNVQETHQSFSGRVTLGDNIEHKIVYYPQGIRIPIFSDDPMLSHIFCVLHEKTRQ